ncbi:hypothetical protein HJA90_10500 [Rhizobium bangladeshense]|uniref:hypothetical protein n=1 Tax=Rhizobium bangladeshense TaxID=1138189 RepID=UPI001C83FE1E|nr:hypothetical protein [Rhizobium bangladeshense]MBX4884012.1 hypothetical protein [Rhizobium bangladeshense]
MIEILIGLFVGGAVGVLWRSIGGASKEPPANPRPPVFDELLDTLRMNLRLLREELHNRRFSGVSEYIAPVETAICRTKKAIAVAERWTD